MYFNAETQSRILARFHFALNDTGVIFLGKAEMLLTRANLFNPVHLKHRIFMKVAKPTLRDRLMIVAQAGNLELNNHFVSHVRLRDAAFDAIPVAQVVLDLHSHLVLINQEARTIFGIRPQDVGRPFMSWSSLPASRTPRAYRAGLHRAGRSISPISNGPCRKGDAMSGCASGALSRYR